MSLRRKDTPSVAAAKAAFSTVTALLELEQRRLAVRERHGWRLPH